MKMWSRFLIISIWLIYRFGTWETLVDLRKFAKLKMAETSQSRSRNLDNQNTQNNAANVIESSPPPEEEVEKKNRPSGKNDFIGTLSPRK